MPCRAVLIFVTGLFGPRVTVKQQPDDVLVLEWDDVPRSFKRGPSRLSPLEVDEIFMAARHPETWQLA